MNQKPTHNILSYFQNLLEFNKLNFLRDVTIEDYEEKYAGLIDSVDAEKGLIKYWNVVSDQHNNGEPIERLLTHDFYKKFKEELFSNSDSINKAIDKLVYTKSEADKPLLQNINQELHYLQLRANKLYTDNTDAYYNTFIAVSTSKENNKNFTEKHEVLKKLSKGEPSPVFYRLC